MQRFRRYAPPTLLVLLVLLAASCGRDAQNPTAAADDGLIRLGSTGNPSPAAEGHGRNGAPGKPDVPGPQSSPPAQTLYFQSGAGGTLQVGRYQLTVPPGALPRDMPVTLIAREESGYVMCELLPHGLVFQTPVRLTIDLTRSTANAQTRATVYWLDEQANEWVDIHGTFDAGAMLLWVDLPHFSRYAAGRAGW
ncbi:MAG: hypothetical protein QUU85_13245 [Candidatus Eisenbacteria bacterium]|nr:hypothetical protein [Candidatus Eisenbacteria bacterium]